MDSNLQTNFKNAPPLQRVVSALIAIGLMGTLVACLDFLQPSSESSSQQKKSTSNEVYSSIHGNKGVYDEYAEGERQQRFLVGSVMTYPLPDTLTYVYTPPPGVTDLQFPGQQPSFKQPNGSYVFSNLPVDAGGRGPKIEVTFTTPKLDFETVATQMVDTLQVGLPNGSSGSSSFYFKIVEASSQSNAAAVEPDQPAVEGSHPASLAADDYYLWETHLFSSDAITLTTAECNDQLDFWRDENNFLAIRSPVLPVTETYTGGLTLPVAFRDSYSPTLALIEYSPAFTETEVFSIPLTYQPAQFTFLANALPHQDGEHWIALSAAEDEATTCPAGLNISAEHWVFDTEIWFDFGGEQDTYKDQILWVYYCHRGQNSPVSAGVQLTPTNFGPYQGQSVTCLGAHPLRLRDFGTPNPPFVLYGEATGSITPTQTISFHHTIRNLSDQAITVTLSISSSASLPWALFEGTQSGPTEPRTPLEMPITLENEFGFPNNERHFWLIAEMPAATESGPETVRVTAHNSENPAQTTWTSDLVWVGDWVAPPPKYKLYFPLIAR